MFAGCKDRPRLLDEYERARELRSEGLPIKQIASRLGVSPSTAHRWTKDIELSPSQRVAIQRGLAEVFRSRNEAWSERCREKRREYQLQGRRRARSGDRLHHAGCMLYWAEGAKDRNSLTFANSDPHMVSLFTRFLTQSLELEAEDIGLRINVHTNNGLTIHEIEEHWLAVTGLPSSCCRAHTLDCLPQSSKRSRRRRLPYGVCSLRVTSTQIVQHVFGAIQEYGGFDEPDWLDC